MIIKRFFLLFFLFLSINCLSNSMEEIDENPTSIIKKEIQQNITIDASLKCSHWGLKNWKDNVVKYINIAVCCGKEDLIDCCGWNSSFFTTCLFWGHPEDCCYNQNNCLGEKIMLCPFYAACHILCLPGAFCTYVEPHRRNCFCECLGKCCAYVCGRPYIEESVKSERRRKQRAEEKLKPKESEPVTPFFTHVYDPNYFSAQRNLERTNNFWIGEAHNKEFRRQMGIYPN